MTQLFEIQGVSAVDLLLVQLICCFNPYRYYDSIQRLPRLDKQDMDSYLSEASQVTLANTTSSNAKDQMDVV